MNLPSDYHVHTHHSGDSDAPMEDVILSAIGKNLKSICFTEHMDFEYPKFPGVTKGMFEVDTDAYHTEYLEKKKKFKDRIDIYFGIELGMQPQVTEKNKVYVNSYPFDFVIASNHLAHQKDPYYPSFYENRSKKEAFTEFFEATLENIKLFDDFDVLGHLDYLVRYAPDQENGYTYSDYKDIINEILVTLINKGKGLDVNTKALYSNPPLKNPNPSEDILKRYKELGGEILTLGSDAHVAKNVACGFEKATDLLKSCGFTRYCTFIKRKATFHDL